MLSADGAILSSRGGILDEGSIRFVYWFRSCWSHPVGKELTEDDEFNVGEAWITPKPGRVEAASNRHLDLCPAPASNHSLKNQVSHHAEK
ncbi:hypothetical protein R1flu_016834 [Riccia fluitans]|uniref:Uncharacterized protein n=1 Tax=Riccia fluitans TaxID=41844 RepID=A0ABD1YMZ4_9MARC